MPGLLKLIKYWLSAVNVLFNPFVGPLSRIKISFPLLSMCTDELISAPKIVTFLHTLPSGKEYSPQVLNSIPKPQYEYLSGSAFSVNLTPPNKQPPKVKSVSKFGGHESNW